MYASFAKLAKRMVPGKKPEGMDPRMKKDFEADYDFEFEEKHKTVSVSEKGVAKAEKFLGISHLYRAENGPLVNHLQQALKAESLYKRDVDYAVIGDGEVKIIDEFTGRILEGRRWSEGLHQAVEAKEGVHVQEESQTLATITLQNYFRLYDKLAGMTGTALTEATRLHEDLQAVGRRDPDDQKMVRADRNDQVYKTKDGKWDAVSREIIERHEAGQPVLVGTVSVEVSELLSGTLDKHGIKHTVLNAKPEYAEREGEIVAEAGQPGAVMIATNMAGRGVDIKLGGNPEHAHAGRAALEDGPQPGRPGLRRALHERAAEDRAARRGGPREGAGRGGLYIVGTERHESRRIDNQLRGRSGRQGDPGESRFFLSAEDDLVRLFAGDRIYKILDRLGTVDEEGREEPIEASMLSKQIEKAQKKVEGRIPAAQAGVEYDDVMNEQRRIVYLRERRSSRARTWARRRARRSATSSPAPSPSSPRRTSSRTGTFRACSPRSRTCSRSSPTTAEIAGSQRSRGTRAQAARRRDRALQRPRGGARPGASMRAVERFVLLQFIDQRWREHSSTWTTCARASTCAGSPRSSRSSPTRTRRSRCSRTSMGSIWADFTRMIYNLEVEAVEEDEPPEQRYEPGGTSTRPGRVSYSGGASAESSALALAAAGGEEYAEEALRRRRPSSSAS